MDTQSLSKGNPSQLGGMFKHSYTYDDLNRLVYASGKAKQASYSMQMTFGRMSEPLTKVQKVDSTKTAQSYDFTYRYEDDSHPTAPTQVGHDHYTYDANGNPILVENDSLNTERRMYWDEDNRLMVLSDNGKTSRYTYNAAGERIVKSHGDLEGVYINGAPQGISFHETEDYTIYPAPIITVTKNRFTKHYFIGDKRVASKLGVGKFSNVYGIGGNNITAGQKDYAARMMQIEKQREEYYKSLGTPPGVPTMKGATADPDNTGIGYNSIITELGDHSVPEGWIQHPKFNGKGDVPGPPIQWSEPESPDNAQPGYGYIANDTTKEETFFYHSDHLGSTSYITDAKANITQFDAYLPYGELLVDEHTSSEDMPYKFNGKEFDEETGLYYYGARYMNPVTNLWYGVDALTEKYPNVGSYIYTLQNPIRLTDYKGLYPRSILIFHKAKWYRQDYYTLSSPAAHVLSLVSGVNESYIESAHIIKRHFPGAYPMLYKASEGGGAVTIGGSNPYATDIYLTENFFEAGNYPKNVNFSNSIYDWLELLSHEVRHIDHINATKNRALYMSKFVAKYIIALIKQGGDFNKGHDTLTEEQYADQGSQTFREFNSYIQRVSENKENIASILNSKDYTDGQKKRIIDNYWKQYQGGKKIPRN